MQICEQSFRILRNDLDDPQAIKRLEEIARVCYQSKPEEDSYDTESGKANITKFLSHLADSGHDSVFEHLYCTVDFITSRGITHELVRHRLASFTQESTRYCNYSKDTFDNEIMVIKPYYLNVDTQPYYVWLSAMRECEHAYLDLLDRGYSAEEARCVLPTCLKAEIVVTANLREWRHIMETRARSSFAHPEMRQLMMPLLKVFRTKLPCYFGEWLTCSSLTDA